MTFEKDLADLLADIQIDSGEWIDMPGDACIDLLQSMGPRAPEAIAAVARLMATHPENFVKYHCVKLLVNANLPEADEALAVALDLPLDDEDRQALIEEADDSVRLRSHPLFVSKARALYDQWPNSALREFLRHADEMESINRDRPRG